MTTRLSRAANLSSLFQEKGIIHTAQREVIVQALFSAGKHLSAEELHALVAQRHSKIGLATVYRTLNMLKQSGLVEERLFADGSKRYEDSGEPHHDHLLCLSCGQIVEFQEDQIERLQHEVARDHDFLPVRHRMILYGYCRGCRDTQQHRASQEEH